jgi:predicted RNA-binding protein associated with RNAse of E/G family
VRLDPGDVWTEHYWRDRWYSIKEVRDLNGVLKGWYADVVRPVRVAEGLLLAEDLDLDLWLSADRRNVLRLDQDEFTASGSSKAIPPRPRRPFAPLRSWNGKPAGDSSCSP